MREHTILTKAMIAVANDALVYEYDNLTAAKVVQLAARYALREARLWSGNITIKYGHCRRLSTQLEEAIDVLVLGRQCNLKLHRLKNLAHETFVALMALHVETRAGQSPRQAAA